MKKVLFIIFSVLLTLSQPSFAQVTHASVNKLMFELGAAPVLKLNIVSHDVYLDQLQFIVVQKNSSERLIVHPLHGFLIQLIGFDNVTDKNAQLIVRRHIGNRWHEIKRLHLFDGTEVVRPRKPLSVPTVVAKTNLDSSNDASCILDYQGKQTLWRLGLRYASLWEVNVYSSMLAIFEANPKAFNHGDIHGLRADVRLYCPSADIINKYHDANKAKLIYGSLDDNMSEIKLMALPREQRASQCLLEQQNNKTLWKLGMHYAPQWRNNVYGAMLAIFEANPKAFNKGSIHGLKADAKLRCPTEELLEKYRDINEAKVIFKSM